MTQIIRERRARRISGTRQTAYSAVFLCLGLILPYVTSHAFGIKGTVLLPMHIPVFLAGFVCGDRRGFAVAILTVTISSLATGMPAVYPMLPIMMAELAMYGFLTGFLYQRGISITRTLIIAMLAGRTCYAIVFYILLLNDPTLVLSKAPLIAAMPVLSNLLLGVVGMIIQLLIIPPLATYLTKKL